MFAPPNVANAKVAQATAETSFLGSVPKLTPDPFRDCSGLPASIEIPAPTALSSSAPTGPETPETDLR